MHVTRVRWIGVRKVPMPPESAGSPKQRPTITAYSRPADCRARCTNLSCSIPSKVTCWPSGVLMVGPCCSDSERRLVFEGPCCSIKLPATGVLIRAVPHQRDFEQALDPIGMVAAW